MINQERIKNLLLELVQIDSHSRKERDVAELIKRYCEGMGMSSRGFRARFPMRRPS